MNNDICHRATGIPVDAHLDRGTVVKLSVSTKAFWSRYVGGVGGHTDLSMAYVSLLTLLLLRGLGYLCRPRVPGGYSNSPLFSI